MFDTMTLTKAVASFCAMFLVLLLGRWAADAIYHVGGHYGDQAYIIDTGADDAPVEVVEAVPFAEVFAAADAGAGERLWRQCAACHALNGNDGVGPHLNGVVGREKASAAGYAYSDAALSQAGDVWSPENLEQFLLSPRNYMPGTKMAYSGMANVQDRANLIAYLEQTGG
jgi:cytochrome c